MTRFCEATGLWHRYRALRGYIVAVCGLLLLAGFALPASANPSLIDFDIEPCNLAGGLHSEGEVLLSAPAVANTVIQITNRNPAARVPATVTVLKGETTAEFDVLTLPVTQKVVGSIYGTLDGVSVWMTLTVRPVTVENFSVANNYVCEGSGTVAEITLETVSPYDTRVTLQSDTPGLVSFPNSVVIPAGSISTLLPLQCGGVTANTRVILAATANGMSRTTTLTVRPMRIQSFALSVNSIVGGSSLRGALTLEAPAPSTGKTIALYAGAGGVSVPRSVFVPAGQTTVQFAILTSAVTSNATVTLEATVPAMNAFAALLVRVR